MSAEGPYMVLYDLYVSKQSFKSLWGVPLESWENSTGNDRPQGVLRDLKVLLGTYEVS